LLSAPPILLSSLFTPFHNYWHLKALNGEFLHEKVSKSRLKLPYRCIHPFQRAVGGVPTREDQLSHCSGWDPPGALLNGEGFFGMHPASLYLLNYFI